MKKTKKNTFKENLKRVGLWVTVLAVLASTVSVATTYADEVVTVRGAMDLIEDATTKQAVAQKFARCLGSRTPNGGSAPVYSANRVSSGSVYQSGPFQTNIATGTWLENQVQGNGGDDGEIYCSQGIWSLFASTFGLSNVQIACDKFSDSGNGHLKGGLFKHTPDDVDCQDMSGFYMAVDAATAEAYIGRLYTEAVADNPYAKSWGEIANYDSATGYSIYKRDLQTSCISEFSEDASNAGHFDNKVKVVNEKGEILEFYALSKSGKKGSTKVGNTIASAGEVTCDDLIAKMNAYAEDYRQAILEAKRKECASPDVVAKVAEYIAKYEEAEELTEEEQADYEAMKQARDSGDYTTPTDKGGLECTNFKYLTVHEPSPTSDPTSDPTSSPSGPTDPHAAEEEACYQHAKSLGWIICPVIYGLKEMSEHFYEAITPLLQVNDSVVSQFGSNSSSLYKVWATFRNIANIIFVIMFMAVILSQLTGYGIDNYGIKRMLPKLIITAILVNISFWLCAIAVDISNILGKTIKEFLESLAVSSSIGGDSTHAVGYIVQKVVGWIAVAGTVAVGVGVAFALEGWAIIVPILLFLLVVVIAIFFALVILGLRQALVVILLVISPLALVCTLLPNTEGVFKKWLSAAKGMLMVYPIIGAVIGAGYLTASILMGADQGFIMTLVAGVLMVGPYFMIPSLTRKALDAVGGIGTRVGNIGRGLGSHARNSIAGSEAARNARADSREAASARRANRYLNSRRGQATERALRNGDSVSTRRARRYARAQELSQGRNKANLSAYDSMLSSRESENRLNRMQTGGLEAREFAQDMSAQEALLSDQRLTSEDGRAAWEAGLESKALEAAISDQSALFERDGIFDNPARFEQEVQAAAQSNDIAKLQALMRKATNGSDEHRRALRNGFNAAVSSGNVNERTAGTYSSHVTGNSIYKSQDRSLHDQAQAIGRAIANGTYGDGASFTSDNYAGNGIFNGKQASTAAFKFDDAEFDALAAKAASGTAKEKQQIANFMQGALDAKANDTTGQYNDVKPETLDQIRRVLGSTGVTPTHSSSVGSGSVKIDHATQAGSQQIQATQNAAATANAARAAQAGLEAGARARNQVITDSERASIRDAIDKAERGGGRQTDSGIWTPS